MTLDSTSHSALMDVSRGCGCQTDAPVALSSSSPDGPTLPHSMHLPRRSPSLSFRRPSDHFSRLFRDSTCSLHRVTSSRKLSSTSRVISYMAALKTVSMTPESWD